MATVIALIIFCASFVGLLFLVFKKAIVLANLPQEIIEPRIKKPIKQEIFQKTALVRQAILHNRGTSAVMARAAGTANRFKTIFANRITTKDDLQKVEQIHTQGDYWQKVETHNKMPKAKIVQASAVETQQPEPAAPQPKTPRIRKKKMPE